MFSKNFYWKKTSKNNSYFQWSFPFFLIRMEFSIDQRQFSFVLFSFMLANKENVEKYILIRFSIETNGVTITWQYEFLDQRYWHPIKRENHLHIKYIKNTQVYLLETCPRLLVDTNHRYWHCMAIWISDSGFDYLILRNAGRSISYISLNPFEVKRYRRSMC